MNINKILKLFFFNTVIYFLGITTAYSFTCMDKRNVLSYKNSPATANVYVDLQPRLEAGQNLVVDLSQSITCWNDNPNYRRDMVSVMQGSAYGNVLANFRGTLNYYGLSYPFPLNSATHSVAFRQPAVWNAKLYLSPLNSAEGIVLSQGTHFATLVMYQVGSDISGGGNIQTATFIWKLYANNTVVVPVGGCDVSSRNLNVYLPDYPGSSNIPLSVYCGKNQNVSFYLSGSTTSSSSIFANTYSGSNAARGLGVQITRYGTALSANQRVRMGQVGPSPVSLNLQAKYERTTGQVTAGPVQSVVGVSFVYD
ncbi:fimbrial protein [Providencia huaxiensis]|uniref:Fimbrial protein n=2 Tax=Morganellaceae TaxID=1903414 RepID=A0A3R8XRT3_PRORE|nr:MULTISPECIES: fimbrial protein [Providencia]ELR5075477.1 fimbrial protein [Providencia stuartii]ELR5219392.1 fimbrial protein [Providencia rettgeri]ELR5221323.1 fimbrial protein [Providencia rettgeri]MBV2188193.1 fimbrial protein [Providencia rettgeri]MDX7322179.1 fimbrial protein [Providencia rettgeri]